MKFESESYVFIQENAFGNVVFEMASIFFFGLIVLTHQGQVMHMSNSKLTIIGSDNGFSPGRHQTIIWTNACLLSIGPLGTSFSEILIKIRSFSLKKMHLNVSSAIWRQFCLGLNA